MKIERDETLEQLIEIQEYLNTKKKSRDSKTETEKWKLASRKNALNRGASNQLLSRERGDSRVIPSEISPQNDTQKLKQEVFKKWGNVNFDVFHANNKSINELIDLAISKAFEFKDEECAKEKTDIDREWIELTKDRIINIEWEQQIRQQTAKEIFAEIDKLDIGFKGGNVITIYEESWQELKKKFLGGKK